MVRAAAAAKGPSPSQANATFPPLFIPPPSPSLLWNRVMQPGDATADGHVYNGAIERCICTPYKACSGPYRRQVTTNEVLYLRSRY